MQIIILSVVMMLTLLGCGFQSIKMDQLQEGNWKARALVRDIEQSRSYIVNLNFNAIKNEKARMDVTSALNTGVAVLVSDAKEVRYILFDSKRFYFGANQSNVMRPILSIPFDPRWIHNVLFELPFPNGWKCKTDSGGWLQECSESGRGLKVTWSSRQGARRTISIDHAKAIVQIHIQSFKPKVEDRKNLFVLEAPAGYQKLRVR